MKEQAVQFGEQNRLHGVMTLPEHESNPDCVLILVSAGLTTKSGPYGLYTQLAREVADIGVSTLRFDLGGLGNSEILHADATLLDRTHWDLEAAVNFLESTFGTQRCLLCGLCSGAEDSFRYADEDPRVKGVVLIDPHAYRTKRWQWFSIFSRHFLNRVAIKALKVIGLHPQRRHQDAETEMRIEGVEFKLVNYQYMALQEASAILERLLEREVSIYYIYTGGQIENFNHENQFYDMFRHVPNCRKVTVSHCPSLRHTQMLEEDRQLLITLIRDWIGNAVA